MYRIYSLKRDFRWLLAIGVTGAVGMMFVFQRTNEIALPGDLQEKPGEIVLGFVLITVMIGFIAGALRSLPFVASRWGRRTLIVLGLIGFALPMMDIGDEGGLTLVDVYEVLLPSFLLAALLIALPQLVYAGVGRIRSGIAKLRTAG